MNSTTVLYPGTPICDHAQEMTQRLECPESESVELNADPQPPKRRKEAKITNFFF